MVMLIQLDRETLIPVGDNATVIDSINYYNWSACKNDYKIYYQFMNDCRIFNSIRTAALDLACWCTELDKIDKYIPIGTIEFCNWHLSKFNRAPIRAINIPVELNFPVYTKRDIWIGGKSLVEELLEPFEDGAYKELFIKSNRYVKETEPLIARTLNDVKLDRDIEYFMSQKIDIKAEWRVFVRHKKALDCKQYCGHWEEQIDKDFVKMCIANYKDCPESYTLDIASIGSGRYAVIEVHNFISCGLYGFEHRYLANMVVDGWKYELNRE